MTTAELITDDWVKLIVKVISGVGLLIATYYADRIRRLTAKRNARSSTNIISGLKKETELPIQLELLRDKLNAERVAIIYYDERTRKANMTHERIKPGTRELKEVFTNISVAPIASLLIDLEKNGYAEMNQDYEDADVVALHRNLGIYSTFKVKLNQRGSISDGCLVVAYDTNHIMTESEKAIIFSEIPNLKYLYNK